MYHRPVVLFFLTVGVQPTVVHAPEAEEGGLVIVAVCPARKGLNSIGFARVDAASRREEVRGMCVYETVGLNGSARVALPAAALDSGRTPKRRAQRPARLGKEGARRPIQPL